MIDRHQAEVRYVLALRADSRSKALEYIELVAERRGRESAQRLQDDAGRQWERGNKGEWGVWK